MLREDIKKILREATGDSGGRGSYILPMQPGVRLFDKSQLGPFTDAVSKYDDAELEYDSYDGQMSTPKKDIKKMEKEAIKISKWKKKHPVYNDDDGDNINPTLRPTQKKINMDKVSKPYETINEWVEITDDIIAEDLAVWFGTKKKPKGSKQPKGPWVNICKKVDGKHPPCGRSEATDKAYPKCRAAGVAGKMSDSQKKAACAQKRKAEKTHSKSGTGNKPKMVSYKPKKKMNEMILNILEDYKKKILIESSKKDVLINKLGVSPDIAEKIVERSGPLSVWISNKILDEVKKIMVSGNQSTDKENIVQTFNNAINNRTLGMITSIMDYIRIGLNGNYSSVKDLDWMDLYRKSQHWHESLGVSSGEINYVEPHTHNIILDFRDEKGNGYYWVALNTKNSEEECQRMGHCGRSSYGDLYSLREVKPISDKYKINKSHLTAAINSEDGTLYQLKGPKNSKPKEEFHQYILPLFYVLGGGGEEKDYLIRSFGTEYASRQDFRLSDLPNEVIIDLYKNRPKLFNTRSLQRKLIELGVIQAPEINYIITIHIDPSDVGEFVSGDRVLRRRKVKRKSPAGREYETTVDTMLFETILSGDAWELWDNYDVDWKSSLDYNVDDKNNLKIREILEKIASKENNEFNKEEFDSQSTEELINEYDEDGDIKRAISNATNNAESDSYVNHLYDNLKSELEEIGVVKSMTDEGVELEINMRPYLNNLSEDEYDDYMERCEDDLDCVFREMLSDGMIDKGKFNVDDRWYPDIDDNYLNELLSDNLEEVEYKYNK